MSLLNVNLPLKSETYCSVSLFLDSSLASQSFTNFYDFCRACSLESKSTTGSLATLFATMAIPVPICPDPTTPKDFTVENLEKTLNIIDRDIIQLQIFQVILLINYIIFCQALD